MLCEATHWSHLPVGGGWYDQHPMFVDEVFTIFDVKGKVEARKRREEESRRNPGPTYGPPANL